MPFISTATTSYDPATNSYSFNLAENSPAGSIIGRVGFEGGGPGTVYYTILGSDRQKVRLDFDELGKEFILAHGAVEFVDVAPSS